MTQTQEVVDEEVLQIIVGKWQTGTGVVEVLFQKGIEPSTQCMYKVAGRKYLEFCRKYGWPPLQVA